MKIEDCKGCFSCGMESIKRNKANFEKVPMCPCASCLVKMVCEDVCPTYSAYIKKYEKMLKELIHL